MAVATCRDARKRRAALQEAALVRIHAEESGGVSPRQRTERSGAHRGGALR